MTPPGSTTAVTAAFGAEALEFFAGLEADNSRAYWTAHKPVFDAAVAAPMQALLASLPESYQPFRTFRMNRDLRFSPDRSPYKTRYGAAHEAGGAVHYLHLDARGLTVVCGAYLLAPDQLARYRAAVADDRTGPALQAVLDHLWTTGFRLGHGAAALLTGAPRGYPRDHPRIDLLRQKGVIAYGTLTDEERLREPTAVRAAVLDAFTAGAPLNRWITDHVGASTTGAR